jgi:hypothetical protein
MFKHSPYQANGRLESSKMTRWGNQPTKIAVAGMRPRDGDKFQPIDGAQYTRVLAVPQQLRAAIDNRFVGDGNDVERHVLTI